MPADTPLPLAEHQGKRRVLLIAADSDRDPEYRQQRAVLDTHRESLAARDVVIVTAFEGGPASTSLREACRLPETGFGVALLGKDGKVEDRLDRPLDPDYLLGLIDQMPRRQQEMEERGESTSIEPFFQQDAQAEAAE